ncbi:hypothetical protein BC833DRAFT_618294 [Globomyces pollinis-pini]|nr:hypothetical protein BC833DRAFT_618294 [Globomyces pollinis-pini]
MNWIERSALGIMFSVPVQSKVVSVKQKQEVPDPKKQFLKRFQQNPASPKYDRRSDLEILNSIVHSSDREFDSLDDGNSSSDREFDSLDAGNSQEDEDDEDESILEEESTESDKDMIDLPGLKDSLNESTETSRLDENDDEDKEDEAYESTGLTETFHLMMLRHQSLNQGQLKDADDEDKENEAKLPDSMRSIKCYQTPVKTILQDSINIQTPGNTQDEEPKDTSLKNASTKALPQSMKLITYYQTPGYTQDEENPKRSLPEYTSPSKRVKLAKPQMARKAIDKIIAAVQKTGFMNLEQRMSDNVYCFIYYHLLVANNRNDVEDIDFATLDDILNVLNQT